LGFGVVSPSSHSNIVGTDALNHSVEWKLGNNMEWSVYMETEVFVKSFDLRTLCLVKIDNSPSLSCSSIVSMYLNWVSFFVLTTLNIKNLTTLPVDELILLILEDLPPTRVCAPDLHVSCSSRALDIPRLIVISSSDSQGLLVEVPDLGSSAVWNLDDHVSVVNEIEISVVWQFRNNVEISLNVKSESLIELSFSWLTLPFINVDDVPLLVDSILLLVDSDVSVFSVSSTLNFQYLTSLVDD
jgi:hypothetical protein